MRGEGLGVSALGYGAWRLRFRNPHRNVLAFRVWGLGFRLSSDDVFQETSARYRAVEPEQWLQRHSDAGSS